MYKVSLILTKHLPLSRMDQKEKAGEAEEVMDGAANPLQASSNNSSSSSKTMTNSLRLRRSANAVERDSRRMLPAFLHCLNSYRSTDLKLRPNCSPRLPGEIGSQLDIMSRQRVVNLAVVVVLAGGEGEGDILYFLYFYFVSTFWTVLHL